MKRFLLVLLFVPFLAGTARSQTVFSKDGGMYTALLDDLHNDLMNSRMLRTVNLDGKERLMFVSWMRDHVHTMKAYKYWETDLSSYLEFFLNHQTPKGMYYDYWDSYKNHNVGQLYFTNVFDNQFYFVDVKGQLFFFRMPIEADNEYLAVEGVYTNWQTSGDKAFISKWIPTLVKGLKYEMSDPLRWSQKYQLVKRPYSIDTWDYTSEPDSLKDNARLIYHIGNDLNTPKGIMHGDNSGMYQACEQLSAMYSALDNPVDAKEWKLQGDLFRTRLNKTCWNGKYYAHFIPEEPVPPQIKSNPYTALSLSNTYDINRGAPTTEMAGSIIRAYQKVRQETRDSIIAGWFGIYPFIQPQFGKYKAGEYMDGAVLPLVGGELTKAAFENGYEKFAVEQLNLLNEIMDKNKRQLPGCVNADGTSQSEDIPDVWGQAAFVSALVEGLAGVVDKSVLFHQVEISPRWIFAGVDKMSVKVGYGGDGNQVSYTYAYKAGSKKMTVTTSGSFNQMTLRLPFPEGTSKAVAMVDKKPLPVTVDDVNGSQYAVIRSDGSEHEVSVVFK